MAPQNSNSHSSYVQCARCSFWVTKDQPTCPNCGIEAPSDSGFWKLYPKPTSNAFAMGAAAVSAALGAALTFGAIAILNAVLPGTGIAQDAIQHSIAISTAFGLLSGGVMFWAGRENNRRSANRQNDCFELICRSLQERLALPQSLCDSEQQLTKRIGELQQKGQDTAALDKALGAVREAVGTARLQSAHARLLLERITMLRWQNKLEPLVMEAPAPDDVNVYKQRIQQVEALANEGRGLLGALVEPLFPSVEEINYFANAPSLAAEERQLRRTWEELLAGCDRLKNDLLTQQALAAVEQVQPINVVSDTAQPLATIDEREARARVVMTTDFGNLQRAITELREQESRLRVQWEQAEQRATAD